MKIKFTNRIFNLTLRMTTLCSRFLLMFLLAKFVEPSSLGYFGLFTAAVSYGLLIIGFDFYTFTTRRILNTPRDLQGEVIKCQAILVLAIFLISIPFSSLIFLSLGWPTNLIMWFAPILLLEILNQELWRLFIALEKQLLSSALLFVRHGSWAIGVVTFMAAVPESRNLDTVMVFWASSGLLASILGIVKLMKVGMGGWHLPFNRNIASEGIKISSKLLFGTIALRSILTLDKYWYEATQGPDRLGGYVLFFGISNAILAFLDASVFSYLYPRLIRLEKDNNQIKFYQVVGRAFYVTLAIILPLSLISIEILPILLSWLNKQIYFDLLPIFPYLLTATVLNALSLVPHYALYALREDHLITKTNFFALLCFVIAAAYFVEKGNAKAIPLGLNFAFLALLMIKSLFLIEKFRAQKIPPKYNQ